ncbi:DNA glycosylase AlkZ-like family protein [Pedobacter sp. BAL39]|uniref:DNA glycosylase AlkZ-like family protein n=1 Tax=Pedobacter sp. BAL39 TaxID=391596 RepID=UPI00210081B5|nr:crosslink repair DNA glycosylase YcaQ family protein [Pedobacter sp. BAL39]
MEGRADPSPGHGCACARLVEVDVLNVFRHRLKDFFDFDYQIECFVPAAKRKYGYFSFPVLVGDSFVAKMDAKADGKQKKLIVHNLHFE